MKKFLSYKLIKINNRYRIQPYHIVPSSTILEKVATEILTRKDGSEIYQDTIFYDLIKLPSIMK